MATITDANTIEERSQSPPYRTLSPSPTISPTSAHLSCPELDRSFSGSEYSSRLSAGSSRHSNVSNASTNSKRRGYMRPQGATFAESAKNRDSVMSLGSIAHLQYYFARTGLLDGKGAQLARGRRKPAVSSVVVVDSAGVSPRTPSDTAFEDGSFSTIGEEDGDLDYEWEIDPMMLPPTVSTYNHKEQYIAPPPETEALRRELQESLEHLSSTLANVREDKIEKEKEARARELQLSGRSTPPLLEKATPAQSPSGPQRSPGRGWHEIQGMHVLDVVTLAIRAAKDYYTMHEHPLRLNKVKSERQLREELLAVMDVLRRMGIRNFAGGMRNEEISILENWVAKVRDFLETEKLVEAQELKDRESWKWLEGNWTIGDRNREWQFINSFVVDQNLPEWTAPDGTETPPPFLAQLANGLILIHLHNRILKKSRRQFGEIKSIHTDFTKHYRAAENLRFWLKAAEIRWETKLNLDVMALVYNKGPEVWTQFDQALLQWCQAVREEITREWQVGTVQVGIPTIRHSFPR